LFSRRSLKRGWITTVPLRLPGASNPGPGDDYYYGQAYLTATQAQTAGSHYQFVDMAYGLGPPATVQVAFYYDATAGHLYAASGTTGSTLDSESAWFTGDSGSRVDFDPNHQAP
jgi:hypothetical protein